MKKTSISEVMKRFDAASAPKKITVLQENDSHTLRLLLHMMLNKELEWAIPDGKPPLFKPCLYPDQENMLFKEARRLYLFHKGGHPTLTQRRREQLWVQLLECLDANDAEFMIRVRDKKVPKGLTKRVILKAFPDIENQFGQLT